MRQIATLPDAAQARTLADYLLTLRIETKVTPEAGGWELWVCDEDRVALARQELEAFTRNPADPRYAEAARAAEALRRQESREDEAYRRKQVNLGERMRSPATGARPWTTALIFASIAVTLAAGGIPELTPQIAGPENQIRQLLSISPFQVGGGMIGWEGLSAVEHGEVWRLVTPIFLHFGPIHLLFNMLMLRDLGGAVELRRGPGRYLLLVLALAVCSNLGQYYLGNPTWEGGFHFAHSLPTFGGMSGVLYGLFGYVWMKSRYEPGLGLFIHPNTVVFLLGWFFLCMTGRVGPIANGAHAVGLVTGIILGYAPVLWRSLRRG
jgi:GlpG protein